MCYYTVERTRTLITVEIDDDEGGLEVKKKKSRDEKVLILRKLDERRERSRQKQNCD